MNEDPYEVLKPGLISVCAWCYPGNSIVKLFPDLEGVEISHGVCRGHKERFLAQMRGKEIPVFLTPGKNIQK